MTGSPMVESLSALTPPIPRPRGRRSGPVVLRPCEEAPDPRTSVAALSRLGVPQVSCASVSVRISVVGDLAVLLVEESSLVVRHPLLAPQ